MAQLSGVWSSVREFWQKMSKQVKILLCVGIVAVFGIALGATLWLNSPKEYVELFTNMDPAEASQVVQILTDAGVDSRLEQGSLMIPAEQENLMRLKLAGMGYPKSTLAYPILKDNITMFSTESEKREWNRIQDQERLMATLKIIDGVQSAVATLSIPEQKDYVLNSNQKPPTASITLSLVPDYVLTQEQIKGIEYLVLKSVSGLTPENISIIDNMGRHLNGEDLGKNLTQETDIENKRLEYKKDLESTIRSEVLNVLTGIYGTDGVTASVAASLDFNKLIEEEVQYNPSVDDRGMISHEDKTEITGSASEQDQTVGADPNAEIPTYPTTTDGTGQNYSESSQSTSYLVNSLKKQSQKDGYQINKLTVSVAVNNPDLSDQERTELVRAVALAAGTDVESVSVIGREFLPVTETGATPTPDPNAITRDQVILYGSIGGGVLLVLLIVIIALVLSARKRKRQQQALEEEQRIREREEQQRMQEIMAARAEGEFDEYDEYEEQEPPPPSIQEKILEFTDANPDIAASMLKMWIRT